MPLLLGLRPMSWIRSLSLRLSRPEVRRITASSSLAVADQFLFALSQLIVNLGLARSLTPSDYGAFTLAYTTLLLFGTAHTALLTEPLMVFGSSKYTSSFRHYLKLLLAGHAIVTATFGLLLAAISALLYSSAVSLSTALMYVGLSGPFLLLPWLLRRACYVRLLAHAAALAGALHCGAMLVGLLWLANVGWLSIGSAFLLMAGSSLAASLLMVMFLRSAQRPEPTPPAVKEVAVDHWHYGRWALGSGLLTWLQWSIYYFLLPHFATVAEAGALKAIMNLVLPVLHGYTALSMVLLPALSGAGSVRVVRTKLSFACLSFCCRPPSTAPLRVLPPAVVRLAVCGPIYRDLMAAPDRSTNGHRRRSRRSVFDSAPRPSAARPRLPVVCGCEWRRLTAGVLFTARYHLAGAVLGLTLSYMILAALARRHFVQAVAEQGR